MDNPVVIVLLTLAVVLTLRLLMVFILAKGDVKRIGLAIRSSLRTLRHQAFADKVRQLLEEPKTEPKDPARPSGVPLRLLALLQREGRLLDFLLEDIGNYDDAQIGAAVRDIHRQCQAAIKEHLVLEPVLTQPESSTVDVPPGFDPSAIRLTGNVTGQPPFKGILQHHGWRVKEIKLAPPPQGQDELVVMPAEVELP